MKLAIMQPYFFPYMGYFQLMHVVDQFVAFDNVQFARGGWIHRNRILVNGSAAMLTVPVKHLSGLTDINRRQLADNFDKVRFGRLRAISDAYQKAPQFEQVMPLIKECFLYEERGLFEFIFHSIIKIKDYLNISTELVISSHVPIDHQLKAQAKVLAICKSLGADQYINAVGGVKLYENGAFEREGIELFFLNAKASSYPQFNHGFVPWLSIMDVMMFNPVNDIQRMLSEYELIAGNEIPDNLRTSGKGEPCD